MLDRVGTSKAALDKKTFFRKYNGSSKRLAEDFREGIIEPGRVTATMQFFETYRGAFPDDQDTMASLDRLNQDELRHRALSSLDSHHKPHSEMASQQQRTSRHIKAICGQGEMHGERISPVILPMWRRSDCSGISNLLLCQRRQ
jgi:hypothetical protein